ncbi:pentatricopeptide repeat-containing protein [Iris pallida]|uniref:Pentatricopeptide repeat-containing protein n=1 Tax=Iris pallida TaxID=29817 RepID=A0AAX6H3F1_IRIPA|nr:pentatricopeptide repeat-containing protein [Iris pallida]
MLKRSSFLSPSHLSSKISTQTSSSSSSCSQLSDVLLAASLTKSLSSPKPNNNNTDVVPLPLPDSVLVQLLRHPSLTPSTKLSLFANSSNTTNNSISSSSALLFSLSRSSPRHLLPALRLSSTLSPSAFRTALDSLLRSSRFDDAIAALDLAHRSHPHLLTPHTYSSVVLALLRKSHLPLALSLFRTILLSSPPYPTHLSTNTLLLSLLKSDLRDDFRHLFDQLSQRGYPFDLCGHNILIHAFGLWGHLALALSLFKRIDSPDHCTYNSLLKALCSNGKLKDALRAYEDMKEYGHEPDRFTYRTLIHGCVKSYLVDDAMRLFQEMEYNNNNNVVKANTVVYNALLDGLLKVGKLTEACRFFEKMVSDGVRASSCSFNILIDGLFKNGRAAAGFALFCDLKKKGRLVDAISFSIVVSNLSREGRVAEALDLVKEMEGRGFVVDLVTITSILIGLHKIGRWDMAERLVKHVRDNALLPNVLRWKDDMEASLQSPQDKGKDYTPLFPSVGSLDDIMSWTNLLSPGEEEEDREGHNSSDGERKDEWSLSPYLDRLANKSDPSDDSSWMFSASRGKRVQDKGIKSFDVDMVNTYLSIFLAKGKLSRACKLFEIFSSFGTDPVSYTYNSLMSAFIKKGYMKEAWGILQEIGDKHCPADVATYNLIIQGLGKMGKADLGTNVLDRMLKKGGYLDIVMYNTLLHALGKAGMMDEVNTLFDKMTGSGINPDVVTYNTLIEVHAKAGHVKEAYKFLRKMLAAGCSPNHVTDTILDFLEKEVEQMRLRQASMRREEELDTNRHP